MTPNITQKGGWGVKSAEKVSCEWPLTSKSVCLTEIKIKITRLTVVSKLSVYKLFKVYMFGLT
jgi:hypothetical protein